MATTRLSSITSRILFLLAIASFCLVLYHVLGPAQQTFHSDCTEAMYWSWTAYESGHVFNPDFNYCYFLPFSSMIWTVPLVAVFGMGMLSYTLSMIVFVVLYTLAILYLAKQMKWTGDWCSTAVTASLLVLSASSRLREKMWEHAIYYSLGALFILFVLGLVFQTEKSFSVWRIHPGVALISSTLLLLFSAGCATDGFQMLAISSLPVILAIASEKMIDRETKLFSKKNTHAFALLSLLFGGIVLGMFIRAWLVGDMKAPYADEYSHLQHPSGWVGNLLKFPYQWFVLLGVTVGKNESLTSSSAIMNMIKATAAIILIIAPFIGLFRFNTHDRPTRLLLLVSLWSTILLLFGFVCGDLARSRDGWRLTSMAALCAFTTVAVIRSIVGDRKNQIILFRLSVVGLTILSLYGVISIREVLRQKRSIKDGDYHSKVVAKLKSEGVHYGYATWWHGQAISILSDWKIRTSSVRVTDKEIYPYRYQSANQWYQDQKGVDEYFVLLAPGEYERVKDSNYWKDLIQRGLIRQFDCLDMKVFVFSCNLWKDGHANPMETDDPKSPEE